MRVQFWFCFLALGAAAAAQAPAPSPALAGGTRINARLTSSLDTQHAHVGDQVAAVTTAAVKAHGKTELPKGTRLTGHVTEVVAAQGASAARLGILFDHARGKQGQSVPLRADIVSLLAAPAGAAGGAAWGGADATGAMDAATAMPMPAPMPAAAGGLRADGAAAGVGAGLGAVASPPLDLPALPSWPAVGAGARDRNGAALHILPPASGLAAGQATALGSVLTTPHGNLRLSSGTRMQLRVLHR